MLSTKAAGAEPLKPGKVWDEHSILLLEGREPLSDKLVKAIEQEVRKVRLLWYRPCEASPARTRAARARRGRTTQVSASGSSYTDRAIGRAELCCIKDIVDP